MGGEGRVVERLVQCVALFICGVFLITYRRSVLHSSQPRLCCYCLLHSCCGQWPGKHWIRAAWAPVTRSPLQASVPISWPCLLVWCVVVVMLVAMLSVWRPARGIKRRLVGYIDGGRRHLSNMLGHVQ